MQQSIGGALDEQCVGVQQKATDYIRDLEKDNRRLRYSTHAVTSDITPFWLMPAARSLNNNALGIKEAASIAPQLDM